MIFNHQRTPNACAGSSIAEQYIAAITASSFECLIFCIQNAKQPYFHISSPVSTFIVSSKYIFNAMKTYPWLMQQMQRRRGQRKIIN